MDNGEAAHFRSARTGAATPQWKNSMQSNVEQPLELNGRGRERQSVSAGAPDEVKPLDGFLNQLASLESVNELLKTTASCVRIDRVSKASDKKTREQLTKVYAVLRRAKEMGHLEELASAVKAANPSIKTKKPIAAILQHFFDYDGDGSACTRDKAVLDFAEMKAEAPQDLDKFIRTNGGLYQTYKAFRKERKGDHPTPDSQMRIHGIAPTFFKSEGDEVLARIRLSDAKKGVFEFVDAVPLHWCASEASRRDLDADIDAVVASARASAEEPLRDTAATGLEFLFNKKKLPESEATTKEGT